MYASLSTYPYFYADEAKKPDMSQGKNIELIWMEINHEIKIDHMSSVVNNDRFINIQLPVIF